MEFKVDQQHKLIITEDEEYACYQVEVIEYTNSRVVKRYDGRYSKERLEELYGIEL